MTSSARVPVVMYHDISDEPSPISVSPTVFISHMTTLQKGGYSVLSLDGLVGALRSGTPLPERSVVLTFDDGFDSTYRTAFPVLQRYGFSATVFLVADYCGTRNNWPGQPAAIPSRPLMTWDQAREMARGGIDFGAHTCSHPRLDQISSSDGVAEILRSKSAVESQLAREVRHFAFPYGRIGAYAKTIVTTAFESACSTSLGLVRSTSDRFALERIDAAYINRRVARLGLTSRSFALYLALINPLRRGRSLLARRAW